MCDDELRGKKLKALIPPSSGARYWSADYAERNQSVVNQRITGDNTRWKSITGYHRRSIAATARYRVNLCIKQDAARRYARKCTPCLKESPEWASFSQRLLKFLRYLRQGAVSRERNNTINFAARTDNSLTIYHFPFLSKITQRYQPKTLPFAHGQAFHHGAASKTQ